MDNESVTVCTAHPHTDASHQYIRQQIYPPSSPGEFHHLTPANLQAASEPLRFDVPIEGAVKPCSEVTACNLSEQQTLPQRLAELPEGPTAMVDQQAEQPVTTAQSEEPTSQQQPLRRSTRERRKPAVLVESADEEAFAAAAYAPTAHPGQVPREEDPFCDLMLLIDAAAALSSAAAEGIDSPSSEDLVRAGSMYGSHQSSSSHSHQDAVTGDPAGPGSSNDPASSMAALAIHKLSAQGPGTTSKPRSRKPQLHPAGSAGNHTGRHSSSGLPPAFSRSRKSSSHADDTTAAGSTKSHRRSSDAASSRRALAGQNAGGLDATHMLGKRSSEMTGSLPNLKPRGQGRWQVFLCAQGLKYLYVGQYNDLPSAKHARDLAVLAVHGPRLVPTLNPIENYTQEQIATVRRQMAEKPAARAVMVSNGLWPPAGEDMTQEQLLQEKRSRRLPGLQHLVQLPSKRDGKGEEAGFAPGSQASKATELDGQLEAAAAGGGEEESEAPAAAIKQETAAAAAALKTPRMRASVATTMALTAAAACGVGSAQLKAAEPLASLVDGSMAAADDDDPTAAAAAAAAAAVAASLQHYHARATANPTGTTGIREHKGVFEVFLATPPFKYLYVGRASTLQQAMHLKATAILAIYGPAIARDQFGLDLESITAEEVQVMACKLASKPAALAAMKQYGTDAVFDEQQQQELRQQQHEPRIRRHSSRSSDAGSQNDTSDTARILAAAVAAAAAALGEDEFAAVSAAADSSRKRSAGGCSDGGSSAAASGDVDDALAAAPPHKRRHLDSSSGGGSSSAGGSIMTAHYLQDLLGHLPQQQQQHYDLEMMNAEQSPAPTLPCTGEIADAAVAAVFEPVTAAAAVAAEHAVEGDATASPRICTRSTGPIKTSPAPVPAAAAPPPVDATAGILGVRSHKGGYEAFIGNHPFKYLYVGLYRSIEQAVRAKETALIVLYNYQGAATLGVPIESMNSITTDELTHMAVRLSKKSQAVQVMKRSKTYYLVTSFYKQQQWLHEQQLLEQQLWEQQQHQQQQQEFAGVAQAAAAAAAAMGYQQQAPQGPVAVPMEVDVLPVQQQEQQQVEVV